jgi:hypothetical protein
MCADYNTCNFDECRRRWQQLNKPTIQFTSVMLDELLTIFHRFPQLEHALDLGKPMLFNICFDAYIFKQCLKAGFNPNIVDMHGRTLLDIALMYGCAKYRLKNLIKYGANLNRDKLHSNIIGEYADIFVEYNLITFETPIYSHLTPVECAMDGNAFSSLYCLLLLGGNPYTYHRGENAVEVLYQNGFYIVINFNAALHPRLIRSFDDNDPDYANRMLELLYTFI